MQVIITGSKGRIGTVLSHALANEFKIYGIDIVPSNEKEYAQADISNFEALKAAFEKLPKADAIIHLAGRSGEQWSWEEVLQHNIIGTRNLYECARLFGIKKIVLASSNHVTCSYEGIPPTLHEQEHPKMITVNDPVAPGCDYGVGKAFAEAIARKYVVHGIHSICLRIGTVRADDDPSTERWKKTWLSHRDLISLVRASLLAGIQFGIYYGVSNNKGRFWDISNAEKELGWKPVDDASKLKK